MSEFIQFTHLHTHTPEGSLLDGFMRIEKAIEKVKSLGMDALGVSDHGSMAAHFKFYNACKAAGIHPVLGNELYITVDKRFKKADFESVDFTEDEDGNFQFAYFLPEEKPDDYLDIRELKVKSKINKMIAEAKKVFMLEKLAESLLEGEEFPTKKTALNKQIKLLMENYEKSGYLLCAKGDFSRRNYFSWFPRIGHLLAIAINNEGYQNLLELNNIGQLEGFYGKPRIDYNDIKKYGAGIAATSACMGSVPNQLILKGYLNEAKEEILRYKDAFELFYLEVQPSRNPEQLAINNQLIEWSKEFNIPLICTTDAHMVDRDELDLHQTLTNIGQGSSSYSEDSSDISAYDAAYLMTPEEILANGIPREALQNAYDLSHMCQVDFLDHKDTKFPEYQVPPGETFDTYLETLAWQGLFQLFLKKDYIKDYALYQERLKYELDIIKEKGLSAYFIIVQDYIQFAKDKGIYVAPARGCTIADTTIYTEEGIKPITEIEVGDKIYTHTGTLKEVMSTQKYSVRPEEKLLKIRTYYDDYFGSTYTKDHEVLAVKTNREINPRKLSGGRKYLPSIDKPVEWIATKDLEVGDLVVAPKIFNTENNVKQIDLVNYIPENDERYVITNDTISIQYSTTNSFKYSSSYISKKTGLNLTTVKRNIVNWKKNPLKEITKPSEIKIWDLLKNDFDELSDFNEYHKKHSLKVVTLKRFVTLNEDFFYWIGLMTGNGWITKNKSDIAMCFNINKKHSIYPSLVERIFGSQQITIFKQSQNVISYIFYSDVIKNLLKDIWVNYQFDSKTKELNQLILTSSEVNKKSLINGLWETDGTHKTRSVYTSSSKKLIDNIRFILTTLNIPNSLIFRKGIYTPNNYVKHNNDSWQITIPKHFNHNSIQFYESNDDYVLKRITSIEEVDADFVYDISVKDDHSYLTTSFAAHNSAGGALVAYVLSITELDPIKYNLLFERFLNPERMSLPDIDSDFSHYRRQEVVDYIVDKYGADQVAKIGTYTKMSTKSILKNVGKVMDIDHNTITEWNKQIPVENGNVMELSEALEVVPVIKKAAKDYPDAFDLALDLENMPKSSSVHACFIPQTPVLTDRGYQNIETLRKGQLVLTHQGRYQPIIEVMKRDSYSFVIIHTSSGRILECTPDHPFLVEDRFTQEREWRPASNLTFNDKLFEPVIDEDRIFFDYIYIEDIYSEMRLLTEPVYNISVKEDESYVANGVVVHNCGILINPTSNRAALPLFASKEGDVVTQYEGPILENLGFVKFDVLGIKNLSILEKAINLIKQNHDIEIDLNALEPEDPEVFKLIQSGRTQGIFQISSIWRT